jgi:hypothetical protein
MINRNVNIDGTGQKASVWMAEHFPPHHDNTEDAALRRPNIGSAHSTCLVRRLSTIMLTMRSVRKTMRVALQPSRLKNHRYQNYMSPLGELPGKEGRIVAVVLDEL